MIEESFLEKKEEGISFHIFSVSAAMVGVCLTVSSLLTISDALRRIENLGDETIAMDAVLFLISCVFSYMAIRTKSRRSRLILEKTADWVFLTALLVLALVGVLIAWEYMP